MISASWSQFNLETQPSYNAHRPHTPTPHTHTLFLHQEYHPKDILRRMIRRVYRKKLEVVGGFDRFVVAYSRPRNLRDTLMRTELSDPEGHRASNILANLLEHTDSGGELLEV
jgi:hypothetical protein